MLRGPVERWWNLTKEALVPLVTWETFIEAFNIEYFSDFLRHQNEAKFTNLRQGRLSMVEYTKKFIELGRFAPKMMMNELKKARRFKKRLKPLSSCVCLSNISSSS